MVVNIGKLINAQLSFSFSDDFRKAAVMAAEFNLDRPEVPAAYLAQVTRKCFMFADVSDA